MPRKTAQVLDGMRDVSSRPEQVIDDNIPADIMEQIEAKRPKRSREGMVKYQCRYKRGRFSMEINQPLLVNGKTFQPKDKTIQFENWSFATNNPETIEWLEGQEFFGLGRDVWREEERLELDLAIEAKRAVSALRTFNGEIERLRPHMSAEDFDALMAVHTRVKTQQDAVST